MHLFFDAKLAFKPDKQNLDICMYVYYVDKLLKDLDEFSTFQPWKYSYGWGPRNLYKPKNCHGLDYKLQKVNMYLLRTFNFTNFDAF